MKKRIIALLITFLLSTLFVLPINAEASLDYVVDYADLLSASEEEELNSKLAEISNRQKLDVVVVTVYGIDGKTPTEYADDFYDYNGYGYGNSHDGILLLVDMEERNWAISTCGYGITAFTDAGLDYIEEEFVSDLSDGNYADSFNTFAELCDDFVTQARTGEPYDSNNLPHKPLSLVWLLVSVAVGAIVAAVVVGGMKSQLKTVRMQPKANTYIRQNSMNVTENRDVFLYRTLDRKPIPRDTDSGSGSSTHTSSSGTTHGGSSGSF